MTEVTGQYVDDPHAELIRKVAWLRWAALVETASYALLLVAWAAQSPMGKALMGSIHGMTWLAFVAMLVGVLRPMRWGWRWAALVVLTGPIGAVLVYERIRRHGVPAGARA